MFCKYCNTELGDNAVKCPGCGRLIALMSGQFENIVEVKDALKSIVSEHGVDLFKDSKRFTGLLNDYMPEYEKERRLIKNVIINNVVIQMLDEPDQKLAILKAREYMLNDMFLSSIATEFVLDCFTYMLGWSFTPDVKDIVVSAPAAQGNSYSASSAPSSQTSSSSQSSRNEDSEKEIKSKPFKPFDAIKYKILQNVKIPEGYTIINSFAFDGYGFIKSVRIPSTVKVIGEYAFSECKRLRTVELPDTLRVIQKSAFSSCAALERITLPYGITAIEEGTFSFCQSLEEIVIPSTVSSIGDEAFEGCESLRYITLSDTVKFIGSNVFAFCPSITVQCRENSYVHKFCMTNGIQFEFTR